MCCIMFNRVQSHYHITKDISVLAELGSTEVYILWFCKILCKFHQKISLLYTIYPIRLNGSAIDTFFSKSSTQLSSVNYAYGRGAAIIRRSVHVKLKRRHGDYRNAPLFICRHGLKQNHVDIPHHIINILKILGPQNLIINSFVIIVLVKLMSFIC